MKALLIIIILGGMLLVSGCIVDPPPETGFPAVLSEGNFFKGTLANVEPADHLIPYDLVNALYSDQAIKTRYIVLPEGASLTYRDEGPLLFPVGSFIVKNFAFRQASGKMYNVETRLMLKRASGWDVQVYVWNEGQTEAYPRKGGELKSISFLADDGQPREILYEIPSNTQCTTCHSEFDEILPIGPKARNLNRSAPGMSVNQLTYWQESGWLDGAPASFPSVTDFRDETQDIDLRARAYLDINCAYCHNPGGTANTSRLYLNLENENLSNLGYCKTPVAPGDGTGGREFDIVPGFPDKSILTFRMESTEPSERMPEIGRSTVDEYGVELIRQWISSMEPEDCSE